MPGESTGNERYKEVSLAKACQSMATAGPGTRNDTLNREARSLAGLGIPASLIEAQLGAAARSAGLGAVEVNKTLASGIKSGQNSPRTIPALEPRTRSIGQAKPPTVDAVTGEVVEEPPRFFKCTDTGNAERMAARHGANLCHVTEWSQWLVWDGKRWAQDRTAEVGRLAKDTVRAIYQEAAANDNEEIRKAVALWAAKSEGADKRAAMVKLCAMEPGLQALPEALDTELWRVTCLNGEINLYTGGLEAHRREGRSTKLLPLAFDPLAECPVFLQFLADITGNNTELVTYIQRIIGYSLTGSTKEQCLFFLYGTGCNGKSTLLEILMRMFGEYSRKADMATFMIKTNDGGPRNDVAALRGARFVTASEAEGGKRLAEGLIKEITGGDTINARMLFKEAFEFLPQLKLMLAANYKPVIRGTDDGIWRRVKLIPFTVKITDDKKDKDLPQKLRAELPGILAWAVRGCLDWQEMGLGEPRIVTEATEEYRGEQDTLGDFLAVGCILDPKAKSKARDLYLAYHGWAQEQKLDPLSEKSFSTQLEGRGLTKKPTNKGKIWLGIGILGAPEQVEVTL
jgi:putative DNA primase/helicase